MSNTPSLKMTDLVRIVRSAGWKPETQKGSHQQFKHPALPGRVTIEDHGGSRDVPLGTVQSIMKQAGLFDLYKAFKTGQLKGGKPVKVLAKQAAQLAPAA